MVEAAQRAVAINFRKRDIELIGSFQDRTNLREVPRAILKFCEPAGVSVTVLDKVMGWDLGRWYDPLKTHIYQNYGGQHKTFWQNPNFWR
jgi:hypothetical protein